MITLRSGLGTLKNAGTEFVKSTSDKAVRTITLDRPAARNAINAAMTSTMTEAITRFARDANAYAVVLRSQTPGMFCAGGDVREMAHLASSAPGEAERSLAAEYELVWLLECFSKPVVSLIDGPVMGAGAGMTLVNTHRVAGKNYAFAMPEVRLGFFPDDGVASELGRMPSEIGVYLGLTGRSIGRADAYALGLVTHCTDASHFDQIERSLADAEPVDTLLDGLHEPPGPGQLAAFQEQIAGCFSGASVTEIAAKLAALRDRAAQPTDVAWAQDVLDDLGCASPQALAIALRHIRDAASMDLRQTLMLDYRAGRRLIGSYNFQEGVRALLIDKNRKPVWRPTRAHDITDTQTAAFFHADPLHEMTLPTRSEMQASRV